MRWLSPDGLSIFWISFQGECLVMTRERETNIIMCCQSPLKMGLMTGRASRTHTRSGWTPMCLFIYGYASSQNKVCCIFTPTWHNRVKSHTGCKIIQRTQHEQVSPNAALKRFMSQLRLLFLLFLYDSTWPHWIHHFTYCLFFLYINTHIWHLCCFCSPRSEIYWTGWHTRTQTLPTFQPGGKASQYL